MQHAASNVHGSCVPCVCLWGEACPARAPSAGAASCAPPSRASARSAERVHKSAQRFGFVAWTQQENLSYARRGSPCIRGRDSSCASQGKQGCTCRVILAHVPPCLVLRAACNHEFCLCPFLARSVALGRKLFAWRPATGPARSRRGSTLYRCVNPNPTSLARRRRVPDPRAAGLLRHLHALGSPTRCATTNATPPRDNSPPSVRIARAESSLVPGFSLNPFVWARS